MNSQKQKTAVPWPLIVLFLILSAASIVVGIIFYQSQKKNLLINSTKELSAIADLKAKQIIQWRSERIADGSNFRQNTILMQQFSDFLRDRKNKKLKADLIQYLKGLTENYDYRDALFVNSDCQPVLYFPDKDTIIGDYLASHLPDYIKAGNITLTDLHQTEKVSIIHLDLVIPMKGPDTTDTSAFGALVLRIDPKRVFYPILQSWPSATITSEAILFHQEGDEILYLNELRYMPKANLTLKKSITEENLAEVQALLGMRQTTNAVDYRGVKVIAAMKKIPESPWFLVAKTDRNEVFSSLKDNFRLILIVIVLFNLTTASFLGFLWWIQRVRYYREKYEAELERMALVRHFDYILKYANDIILLLDDNFGIVEANDKALEAYQYTRDEIIGQPLKKLIDSKAAQKLEKNFTRLDHMGYATFESRHKRRDGSVFPIEISARRVDIEGIKFYQAICRDITERKYAEEILKESEERFRKIFEESPLSIAMTDKDMGIIRANNSYCRLLGYSEEELLGMTYKDFTHPDDIQKDELAILQLVSQELPIHHTEKRYLKKDGTLIWGSTTVSIIRNNNGEIQFFLVMVEDITSKVIAATELLAAKEKAEESDRLKTAFLHNVSHEIRTPMNAIMGFSTLLNDPELNSSDRIQFTDIIRQSGNQLLSIINDIVDLASIETGQMKVNLRSININRALKSLCEQFSYKERAQKVKLALKTPLKNNNAEIITDGTKLVQILSNLINNAIKFTPEGRIDIGYKLQDSFLEFSVKDTGIGIPPEYHSKVFERFYQVDNTVSRQYQGTGLGLSICKAYAELLGGKIWLESQPGNGTTFSFTIPYVKSENVNAD
ncbi:MAG TPA: PAS domain-containing sensor histidine kinase [Bacteroidales bacterium]|jgi:PAS domain S-box-containing protein|nr:MAG: Autoinducer 2 sensor kinase/phosphatase LuxQ [Bacteroidetes bacterium ADurb.Bin145]HOU02405.1 PAS domain-containing sensor histidine kinase [Bacteroidales bacterium]HQK68743.1 PAS domain-containing sensor histidine kinase [Bacteroidales bacterium]